MPGSRKPIMLEDPNKKPQSPPEELLTIRDGRELSAIDILVEVHGDVEIAAERADLTEAEFGRYLARCNPQRLAEGFKALQLLQVFELASRVGRSILDNLEEMKPGQLVALYPKLVELIPTLSESKLNLHAHQTNNFNLGPGGADELPPDILAAFERLKVPVPGSSSRVIDHC